MRRDRPKNVSWTSPPATSVSQRGGEEAAAGRGEQAVFVPWVVLTSGDHGDRAGGAGGVRPERVRRPGELAGWGGAAVSADGGEGGDRSDRGSVGSGGAGSGACGVGAWAGGVGRRQGGALGEGVAGARRLRQVRAGGGASELTLIVAATSDRFFPLHQVHFIRNRTTPWPCVSPEQLSWPGRSPAKRVILAVHIPLMQIGHLRLGQPGSGSGNSHQPPDRLPASGAIPGTRAHPSAGALGNCLLTLADVACWTGVSRARESLSPSKLTPHLAPFRGPRNPQPPCG
jgi:hypothetical protein